MQRFVKNFRGVIQTVVEKHFPAPDRRKFFDIFGLGGGNSSSFNEDSNPPTPGTKRKKGITISIKGRKTGVHKVCIVISRSKLRKKGISNYQLEIP